MNPVQIWGMDIVRGFQSFFGPAMLGPMKAVTFLGSEIFALAALPLIYWCVDRKKGARIGIVVLFSAFSNLWCKLLFAQPRPYDFDPSVQLAFDPTSAFPSGHAQTSITFWGAMLGVLRGPIRIAAFIVIPLLVGLSRVYLGVHFPTDVLGGWALGGLILILFNAFSARIEVLLGGLNLQLRLIVISLVALGMNALMPSDTMLSGAFFGSAAGFALASRNLRFDSRGSMAQKALRYIVGIAFTLVLYLGPKLFLDDAFPSQQALVRFLRYALVGIWVAYGAPWCFLKMKLIKLERGVVETPSHGEGYSASV